MTSQSREKRPMRQCAVAVEQVASLTIYISCRDVRQSADVAA